jgi:hypothetical protein
MTNSNDADTVLLQKYGELCKASKNNPLLIDLLTWVDARASQSMSSYSPAGGRAYYFALVRVLGFLLTNYLDPERPFMPSKLPRLLNHFDEAENLAKGEAQLQFQLTCGDNPLGVIARCWRFGLDDELSNVLRKLHIELKHVSQDFKVFQNWRSNQGKQWLTQVRDAIGHPLSYSNAQKKEIEEYYELHKLVAQALKPDSGASLQLREQMEQILLAPL